MAKINLGVDVDGVLTNIQDYILAYGAKFNYENGIVLENLKKHHYNVSKVFDWDEELSYQFWINHLEDYSLNEEPRHFASEVLKKLKQEGCKIYIITARCSMKEEDIKINKIENILMDWLKEHDIPYDKIVFTNEDKIDAIKQNDIDIMIEDSPKNIMELKDYCDVVVYDALYNKEAHGKNVVRVNSWYEILDYIERRMGIR